MTVTTAFTTKAPDAPLGPTPFAARRPEESRVRMCTLATAPDAGQEVGEGHGLKVSRRNSDVQYVRESTPPAGRLPDEPLIGVADLAEWLGVSVHAVKKWTAQGPASGRVPLMIRVNGQIKFRPEDVRNWLKSKEIR